MIRIHVRPQVYDGVRCFGLFYGEQFIAYAKTREKAILYALEIQKGLNNRTVYPDPDFNPQPLTFEQASKVDVATIGERFNSSLYEHVKRVQKQIG